MGLKFKILREENYVLTRPLYEAFPDDEIDAYIVERRLELLPLFRTDPEGLRQLGNELLPIMGNPLIRSHSNLAFWQIVEELPSEDFYHFVSGVFQGDGLAWLNGALRRPGSVLVPIPEIEGLSSTGDDVVIEMEGVTKDGLQPDDQS